MSLAVVLDGAGLQAWAQPIPPRDLLTVLEAVDRHGLGRVIVPSVVTVEALTGGARDAAVNRVLKQIDLDEHLPLTRTRAAAALRQGTGASAVAAVVAEAAVRTQAVFLVTSDPGEMTTLLERGGATTHVVTV